MIEATGYGVIVADPPWRYSNRGTNGAAAKHYPTMSTREICELEIGGRPVGELAGRDAVLILWATNPLLPDALRVLEAWGFDFVTSFPWVKLAQPAAVDLFGELIAKPFYGGGFWARGCSEPILIGKRGQARPPVGSWLGLLAERMEHSRKPPHIYAYAESMPGPYLELFARRPRPGWDAWGNEVAHGPGYALAQDGRPAAQLIAGASRGGAVMGDVTKEGRTIAG